MSTELAGLVAAEVRAEIARKKSSARRMALQLGEAPATVNRWTNGTTPMSLDQLDRVGRYLDLSVSTILARAEASMTTTPGGTTTREYADLPVLTLVAAA